MRAHMMGPWSAYNASDGRIFKAWRVKGPNGIPVCTTHAGTHNEAANARLIAAAPEMLAALEQLFEHCAMVHKHWGEGSNQVQADAAKAAGQAAIAKALGQ